MKVNHKRPKFKLIEINGFDARRGYKRCSLPGVGVSFESGPNAIADFWRDKTKRLLVRISSQGYDYHFEALLASGKQIPEEKLDDFGPYVMDVLAEWLIEGVDDLPSSISI
jgi:hypothetical protein